MVEAKEREGGGGLDRKLRDGRQPIPASWSLDCEKRTLEVETEDKSSARLRWEEKTPLEMNSKT